jgi:apolipoprotein N-acyltransferase
VFPLRLSDGREIPVLPLICLDDVDTGLAIEGTRLGAQAILTMSNDSWFSAHPQGAKLHQAVAAFRSIETRLPQFRVTTNGHSAVMDANGNIIAGSRLGERTLVMGDVPAHMPAHTIMVRWGNWVGLAGAALLACLVVAAILPKWRLPAMADTSDADLTKALPVQVTVLPKAARITASLLRTIARSNLIWLGAAMLLNDALRGNTLAQIRAFTGFFLVPEAAAWCVLLAFSARATLEGSALVLTSGARRLALPLDDIASVETWRLPLPSLGVSLRLKSGQLWRYGLALAKPGLFAKAVSAAAEMSPPPTATESLAERYAIARQAIQTGRLNTPWAKFVLLPVVLALPAFHLHQNIAYGGMFGEYYTFGLKAYLTTFALWWAAWAIGVVLTAAALRALIEAGTLIAATSRAERAFQTRVWLERLVLVMLYIGMPTWLLVRALGN